MKHEKAAEAAKKTAKAYENAKYACLSIIVLCIIGIVVLFSSRQYIYAVELIVFCGFLSIPCFFFEGKMNEAKERAALYEENGEN